MVFLGRRRHSNKPAPMLSTVDRLSKYPIYHIYSEYKMNINYEQSRKIKNNESKEIK
jgi:hypothetical protein